MTPTDKARLDRAGEIAEAKAIIASRVRLAQIVVTPRAAHRPKKENQR